MKKIKQTLSGFLLTAVITIAMIGSAEQVRASHFRYGTLSYKPGTKPGEVIFSLKMAFEKDRYGSLVVGDIFLEHFTETKLEFGDGAKTSPLRFKVTSFYVNEDDPHDSWLECVALQPGSDAEGIRHIYQNCEGTFTAFISNNSANPLTGTGKSCCRTNELQNGSGLSYQLETTVKPFSNNSSPVATQSPIINVPKAVFSQGSGVPFVTFAISATDPDGDNIRFDTATNLEKGFSGPNPTGLSINSSTGIVTWFNSQLVLNTSWTVQFIIKDLDGAGNEKSKTPIDMMLKIVEQQGHAPTGTLSTQGNILTARCGVPVTFSLNVADSDPGDLISISANGVPTGMVFDPGLEEPVASGRDIICRYNPAMGQGGAHVVVFTLTDSKDQQSQITQVINVIAPSLFTLVSNLPGCVNNTLELRAPAGFTSYTWNGPSGFTSTLKDVSRTPAIEGRYSVKVADRRNCEGTADIDFSFGPTTPEGPLEVCTTTVTSTYSTKISDGDGTSFKWTIAPSTHTITPTGPIEFFYIRSSGATVNWNPNSTEPATITVEVKDTCGTTYRKSITVTKVIPQPAVSPFAPTGPDLICQQSAPTVYTVLPRTCHPQDFQWSVTGTGNTITSEGTSATVTWDPEFAGTASVVVKAINRTPCAEQSQVKTLPVTVKPLPVILSLTGGETPVCNPGTTDFTATTHSGSSVTFSLAEGSANTITAITTRDIPENKKEFVATVSWKDPLSKPETVTVTATTPSCGESVVEKQVTLLPRLELNVFPTSLSICRESGGDVFERLDVAGAQTFHWSSSTLSLEPKDGSPVFVTVTPSTSVGSHTISVEGTRDECKATKNVEVTIQRALPPVFLSAPGADCVAPDRPKRLIAETSCTNCTFEWSPTEGLSATTGPEVFATIPASYTVVSKRAGTFCTATSQFVTLNPIPEAITGDNVTLCEEDAGGIQIGTEPVPGNSYSWTTPQGFTSDVANPTVTPTVTTTFTLSERSTAGCQHSRTVTVSVISCKPHKILFECNDGRFLPFCTVPLVEVFRGFCSNCAFILNPHMLKWKIDLGKVPAKIELVAAKDPQKDARTIATTMYKDKPVPIPASKDLALKKDETLWLRFTPVDQKMKNEVLKATLRYQ